MARNLTRNLLTYATGAGIQFADRDVVEEILARVKSREGGLRTLVHEIVAEPNVSDQVAAEPRYNRTQNQQG